MYTGCPIKRCQNGGTRDTTSCDCVCPPLYTGEFCESKPNHMSIYSTVPFASLGQARVHVGQVYNAEEIRKITTLL